MKSIHQNWISYRLVWKR